MRKTTEELWKQALAERTVDSDVPETFRRLCIENERECAKPLMPKMYWEDADRGWESPDDIEALLDAFGSYEDIKVGSTYSLNEAHYFDAEFEITKIPDETNDDYEVKRINGTHVFSFPPAAQVPEWQPIETAPISGRGERPLWFLGFNGNHIGICARWGDEGYGELIADETDEIVTPAPTLWMPLPAAPEHV